MCHAPGHATGLHASGPIHQMQHVRSGGHHKVNFLPPKPKCRREIVAQEMITVNIAIRTQTSLTHVTSPTVAKRARLGKSLRLRNQLVILLQLPAIFSTGASQDRCGSCAVSNPKWISLA